MMSTEELLLTTLRRVAILGQLRRMDGASRNPASSRETGSVDGLRQGFGQGPGSMSTTTKKDLIDRIADQTGQRRTTVKRTVQCFLDNVIDELKRGNRLEFRDFGVFEIRHRAPRVAQNPKTLERVPVPAKKTVKFKVGRLMKQALEENGGGQVKQKNRMPVAAGVG